MTKDVVRLPTDISDDVARALSEDLGSGDLTAALVAPGTTAKAQVLSREPAVLCGSHWFTEVFRQLDATVSLQWQRKDGDRISAGTVVGTLSGPARALLSGERTALNFVQTLSGTATVTRRYVEAVRGTTARILDTRKTLPGLRRAQKYAVRCAGGHNHRMGLFDAVLIKENHIAAAGSVSAAVAAAKRHAPKATVAVEVETLEQFREALTSETDRVLLDNTPIDTLYEAVRLRDAHPGKRVELEASGGIDLGSVRRVAETGVDFISVGALTKHVRAIDFSMRFL